MSIVIVNYNVRFFLEQCLYAVREATSNMEAEVIVVDNHSTDGSMSYLPHRFPWVRFIWNDVNTGFARASNQGLAHCSGEFVLFLNPDTLVAENTLHVCVSYMKAHRRAGALGVRMIDGKGRFLAESKRAFPSPMASFYKITGLSALFPRSGVFNRYALGDLDDRVNHIVPVLAGAFIMADKKLLDSINGFDESYFMYGEDIDLSFRMQEAGYENHYFAGTSIIHFKGESSRRGSLANTRLFYSAMLVFVKQHYRGGAAKWASFFIRLAIGCRALVAVLSGIMRPMLIPLADGLAVWFCLKITCLFWIAWVRHGKDFGLPFLTYTLPCFAALFILAAAFIGLYDRIYRVSKAILAVVFAALAVLAGYSLLPESVRFSRGVLLFGCLLGGMGILLLRYGMLHAQNSLLETPPGTGNTIAIASESEFPAIEELYEQVSPAEKLVGWIGPGNNPQNSLGIMSDLPDLLIKISVQTVIFCAGSVPVSVIIAQAERLSKEHVKLWFHMKGSNCIVGSELSTTTGKVITPLAIYRIAASHQQRLKRAADLIMALFFVFTAPLHLLMHHNGAGLTRNALSVLAGRHTWVGYASDGASLPPIKKCVITHMGANPRFNIDVLKKADIRYARNYDWWQDVVLVFNHYSALA